MRIMLVGTGLYYHVGAFFKKALESKGLTHIFVDDWQYLASLRQSWSHRLIYHLLGRPLAYGRLNRAIQDEAVRFRPDLVLITKGAFIAPRTLGVVKAETGAILVNYATDDPFNLASSTTDLRNSIQHYDLYICTKRAIMEDVHRAGCASVAYVPFGYEPTLHYPEAPATYAEKTRFSSDVTFIGGADADRYPILSKVAVIPGICLHLYGGYWKRDIRLRSSYKGYAFGRDYRLALSGAKIAICLVRRANRDGHVMRTFETPACGAFMLAERTEEHLALFAEDREMVCFGSDEELVDKIRYYLDHEDDRQWIAQEGYEKVTSGKNTYRDRLEEILAHAEALR